LILVGSLLFVGVLRFHVNVFWSVGQRKKKGHCFSILHDSFVAATGEQLGTRSKKKRKEKKRATVLISCWPFLVTPLCHFLLPLKEQ
jgi:hypothetical protein